MEIVDMTQEVKSLVQQAQKSSNSSEAMRFSQAACNAANAAKAVNESIQLRSPPGAHVKE